MNDDDDNQYKYSYESHDQILQAYLKYYNVWRVWDKRKSVRLYYKLQRASKNLYKKIEEHRKNLQYEFYTRKRPKQDIKKSKSTSEK